MNTRHRRTPRQANASLMLATVLVGLSAGFFYTYEASVTEALAAVSDMTYVETFQAINESIRNPAFGLIFFGSIPALLLAAVTNWEHASTAVKRLLIAAPVLYLTALFITGTGNVPLNDDLAMLTDLTPETAARARTDFEASWNLLNLVRTVAVTASFMALAAIPVMTNNAAPSDAVGQNRPL